jgi:catechol 2,3-dioxygenase-like lactoylglutathione lyase family enzyme
MEILADHSSVPDVARAVRFRTPFGPIFEAHTPVPRDGKTNRSWPDCRARRLDHINLRVSDPRGFHDFLTGTLEMRLSDRTSDYGRAWYRTADGFHHTIAAGVGTGFHHFGFDAPSVQDLISVADKLHSRGRTLLWGIGRHGPGDNIFTYYAEPNGCVVETSFGMERIDRDDLREPGVWSAEYDNSVLDLWGSKVPEAYAKAITPFAA